MEERFRAGELPGFLHVAIGQEAVAVGVCQAMEDGDVFASTHRAHAHALARGTHPNALMAELYGKIEGCSHGYGGSMHLYDVELGNLGANAVVGGGLPAITGAALAFKLRGEPRVAVAFFGDGATNIGTFHESLNLAQLWKRARGLRLREQPLRRVDARPPSSCRSRTWQARRRLRHALDHGRRPGRRGGATRRRPCRSSTHATARAPSSCSRDLPARRPLRRRPAGLPRRRRGQGAARDAGPARRAARPSSSSPTRTPRRSTREVEELVEASVEFAKSGHGPEARRRVEEHLCLMPELSYREAVRDALSQRDARATTTSSSWARTSPRWAARWASPRGCSPSSGPSACGTRRSPRWRSSAPASARPCRACARSSRSCTRTS